MQPFIGEGNNHYTNPVQQAKHELVVQGTDRAYQLAKKYGVKLAWGTDLLFSPANARNQNLNIEKMTRWFSNFEILKMITIMPNCWLCPAAVILIPVNWG